jgi:hypothetical protein
MSRNGSLLNLSVALLSATRSGCKLVLMCEPVRLVFNRFNSLLYACITPGPLLKFKHEDFMVLTVGRA